jgi:ABC-type branched-subunit amino acid transport system substrate-binding protein
MNIWIKLAIAAGAAVVLVVVYIAVVAAIVRHGGRHGTYLQLQPSPSLQSLNTSAANRIFNPVALSG